MSAVGQVADLVKSNESLNVEGDYIDVLGASDPIGPHRGQQVFRSKGLPKIYERFWRPLALRLFVGLTGPGTAEEMRVTLGLLGIKEGDQVLDVGCGPGNYTRRLAQAAGDGLVVGLDASETMVAAAAKRGGRENLAYLRGDASALPFDDGSFDAVCCVGVIHMVEEPLVALAEMARVLAPGGRLVVLASCGRPGKPRRKRGGVTIFARNELTEALSGHGLVDVEQQVIGRGQLLSAHRPQQEGVTR